jgi:hypothetical protein
MSRAAGKVVLEAAQRAMVLLEDNGLGLNLTDLLSDDPVMEKNVSGCPEKKNKKNRPLGHLLQNNQALLDDLNALGVADDFSLVFNHSRVEVARVVKVVVAVEFVKVIERAETTPVVKRLSWTSASNCTRYQSDINIAARKTIPREESVLL